MHSTVVRWRFAPRFAALAVDESTFIPFLRQAFAQKRKTLANSLRAAGIAPDSIALALERIGVDPLIRAEALSIESLAAIYKSLPPTPQE